MSTPITSHPFEWCPSMEPEGFPARFCRLSSPKYNECHYWNLHPAGYCGQPKSAHAAPEPEPLSKAPCSRCGYNGVGYYQPNTHPCAAEPSAGPAPSAIEVNHRTGQVTEVASLTVQLNRIDGLPDNHVRGAAAKDCPCHECKKYAGGPAPKDRLGEIVEALFREHGFSAAELAAIRAALEAVVRECASKVGGVVPDTSGCDCDDAILRHWGLEEKR